MANKVYVALETAKSFKASAGDAVFTPTSVANGAGRVSSQLDLGTASRSRLYTWRFRYRSAVAPTVGNATVRVYLVPSPDGSFVPGGLGTTDAAVSSENSFRNAILLGAVEADAASTTQDFVGTGIVEIRHRFISVGIWNDSGQALSATATDMEFLLTPVPDEIQ